MVGYMIRFDRGDGVNDSFGLIKKSFEKMLGAPRFEPEQLKRTVRPLAEFYGALYISLDIFKRLPWIKRRDR